MKKRFIALLLCCVMLLTLSPSLIASVAADDDATPTQTGVTVSPANADLPRNEKVTLTAQAKDAKSFQWQIQAGKTLWVDISGETESTIQVSYAMVASLLSGNKVSLRCKTDAGTSAAVPVTVTEPQVELQAESQAESQPATFSVLRANDPMAALAADDTTVDSKTPSTTYNVVINYVFENNEIVADPYTASLAAGSDFGPTTVTFPVVQGYLPYLNEVQQNSIELNYTNIDQNYTYNVVYKPTNVDYTVIHYQQNLDNDNYTEEARETKQGLTNSTVPDVAKTYDGFYALLYEKPAIAADGSTVVEVYYDRYYYLMNFDLDGGYGVEPIYARYGTDIGDVGTPTKAGYIFKGWSLNGTNTVDLPSTMPAENRPYKAIWKADDTAKVTVVFWGENADDEEYSYIRSMQVDATPGASYSYDGSTLTCPLAEHSHSTSKCELNCTHVHTLDCYSTGNGFTVATKPTTGLTNNGNGIYSYTTTGWFGSTTTHYYLNIGDKWYCGTNWWGDEDDEESIRFDCKHTHTDACYSCGLTEHTHSSACSGLWKFVRSDTVTVAADGSSVVNVYYERTEKTLTFKYNYRNNRYQTTETITAKWGSDISGQYKKIAENAKSTFWSAETSGGDPYTNYFGVMPQTSATYYNKGTTGREGTMTYWGQDLNGKYTVKLFEVTDVGGFTVTDEDRYEFEGFTYHHGTSNGSSCAGAAFYYTRNSYNLTFNDGYIDVKKESVKYEAPLSTYSSYVPEVPSAYESGSVTFGGWYLNPECTGAEYKLDAHTMPADNVLLYAKWVPVSHRVEFYLDQAALNAGAKLSTHPEITVPHGSKADPTPDDPANGSYTFIGWFYMENGVEKAFDFANMPVNKDMQVYGKWSSNVLKQYTIYYKIQGTDTQIADPTTGSGLAGITKTFEAKGGAELYAGYQEGYFPTVSSHSITLDIDNDANNTFTFWYVRKDAVPYTVKYLNKATGEPVAAEKTVSDNRKAVVTETFVAVSGMLPDAYQKRLVVTGADAADDQWINVTVEGKEVQVHPDNVIIFYYTEDTTHAYYKITHYTENLGTDANGNPTWTEYASSQAVGDIDKTYTADPMTIPGFTYDSTVEGTVASGKLTENGLELKLYYTRNSYPYQVRYLEQGTGKQLAAPENGTGKYGEVVSESAKDIANYDAVDPTSQTLNIRIEEGTEAKLNIITFYYKRAVTDLTITKSYGENGPYDPNQSAVFTVTGGDLGTGLTVVLNAGNNFSVTIKGLKVGTTYTVTEKTDWTWRYTPDTPKKEITLVAGEGKNKVTFTNTLKNNKWLTGGAWCDNVWGNNSPDQSETH